jgi:hypothetical protein
MMDLAEQYGWTWDAMANMTIAQLAAAAGTIYEPGRRKQVKASSNEASSIRKRYLSGFQAFAWEIGFSFPSTELK